jgi:error-prone DNA polymerase
VVRRDGPFHSIRDLWRASRTSLHALRRLAAADAFTSMGLDRQQALWQILKLRDEQSPLFERVMDEPEPAAALPPIGEPRKVTQDYQTTGLSLRQHPISFLRPGLDRRGVARAADLRDEQRWPHGKWITLAGLCLIRQRPSTASGIVFMTLEDETDAFNVIVRPHIYEQYRRAARSASAMLVRGRVERQEQVIHIMAHAITDITGRLAGLATASRDFR